MAFDHDKMRQGVRLLLEGMGLGFEGSLAGTPDRVARAFEEIFAGIQANAEEAMTVFHEAEYDEMVLVKDMPFYSMCEHHLLPFHGKAHVAYIPQGGRLTGISKLARVLEIHARRPQVQERMTADIARTINRTLKPKGAMVVVAAEHLCMTMRGVKKPGSVTVTSVVTGLFRDNPATRAEALKLMDTGR